MVTSSIPQLILIATMFTIIALTIQQAHLLNILLILEILILITTLWITTAFISSPFALILLLTPAVCEATLGLALFISLTRSSGSPMIKTLNSSKW